MNGPAAFLHMMTPYFTEILIALLIGIVLVVICIFLILRASRKAPKTSPKEHDPSPKEAAPSEEERPESPSKFPRLNLSRSFRQALRVLRQNVTGGNYRYKIPWFLIIGETGAGKTTILDNTGLEAFTEQTGPDPDALCSWHFFDQGVVLDLKGLALQAENTKIRDAGSWPYFLRLLLKHRPERPLDGIVITLPASDLFGPETETAERLHRINRRASRMYDRIWKAQKTLGMRCPIYILISKCDQIPGFRDLCRVLPEHLQDQMFGWSNPYALDTAYTPNCVPEAFQNLNAELRYLQSELFAYGADVRESDGIFVFPAHFQSMTESIQTYLDRLFKQSAYHESFLFRGIFFCGPGEARQSDFSKQSICFLKDLFKKKIFAESGLARPARKQFLNRNRAILAIQAAAVLLILIWGVGLWWSASSISQDKNALLPTLKNINSGLEVIEDKARVDQHFFTKETMNLVNGMNRTTLSDFSTLFMPFSWIDPLKEDTVNALAIAYDKFFMKSLLLKTQDKARKLVSASPDLSAAAPQTPGDAPPVQQTKTFMALQDYVSGIRELEKHADTYNLIQRSHGEGLVDDLSELTRYLFDQELPQEFYGFYLLYRDALARHAGRTLSLQPYEQAAKARLEDLFQHLYHQLFESNPVSAYLAILSIQLENFAGQSRSALKDREAIQNILKTIEQSSRVLSDPELAWITSNHLELGSAFSRLLTQIDQSELLGRDIRIKMEKAGEKGLKKLQFQLRLARAPLTGPLLYQDNGEIALIFSENLVQLADEFKTLLKQEFMVFEPERSTSLRVPEGMRFIWNIPLLEEAVAQIAPYENFIRQGLKGFPNDLRSLIKSTAKDSFNQSLLHLLQDAQSTSTASGRMLSQPREADLRLEIDNFKEAAKLLDRLLVAFERLGLVNLYLNLSEIVGLQASTLLNAVDLLFKNQSFYTVKDGDLAWWDGNAPLSFMAYEVGDMEELRYYLDLQRKRAQHLAYNFAEPIVAFFMNRSFPEGQSQTRLFSKWERILSALNEYENKQPNNPITNLERLILFEMHTVNADNYQDVLPQGCPGRPSGDFFIQTRNTLCRMIVERSQWLTAQKIQQNYQDIQTYFNDHLAGKFPFAPAETAEQGQEADPEAVRGFFKLLGGMPESGLHILKKHEYFGLSGEKVWDFLDASDALGDFFAPFLPADSEERRGEKLPVYDFQVDLRVNPDFEQGGQRIIEWLLTVGGQEFTRQDESGLGRWRFGEPVSLTLRWAKDSPVYPKKPEGGSRVSIDDRTLVYNFTDKWSLLRLLRGHSGAPEDFPGLVDPKPHTLKFQFENDHDRLYPVGSKAAQTRVYIRITLLMPDEKQRTKLILPERFPEYAPQLELNAAD